MAMSRKDFESLAADIKWQVDDIDKGDLAGAKEVRELEGFVRLAIMPTLRKSNSRFACGF
jgi:hypothetical protein